MVCAYKHNGDAVDYLRRFPEANRLQLVSHWILSYAAAQLIYPLSCTKQPWVSNICTRMASFMATSKQ